MNIPSDKATIGRIVIIKISSLLDALACSSQQSMLEKHILFPTNLKYQPLLPNLRKYKMNIIIITTFIAFQIIP
jgi:hypothetical protein